MKISLPVPSAIGSVDFAFLTTEEIEALSVKQIQNPLTFDTLLHPVPGGLYDPALGAWGDIMYVQKNYV
jgi:DNA-directed RNA polymerase I subunit RPA1